MNRFLLACILPLILLSGCENRREEATVPTQETAVPSQETMVREQEATPPISSTVAPAAATSRLFEDAVEAKLVEYPTRALPVWRQFRQQQPALLLISNNPFLSPTPELLRDEINALLTSRADTEIIKRTNFSAPDILIQPDMALSAALGAGLFSSVYWVYPSTLDIEKIGLDKFKEQMLTLGLLSPAEATSLHLNDGSIQGHVRGVPFKAIHPKSLHSIKDPVVVHFDLSFFPSLYKGEIKTPLYSLIKETLNMLKAAAPQALAVTVSYSNLTSDLPLASRFIGPNLVSLMAQPALIDAKLPPLWELRRKALYLPNFFQADEINKLYLKMEQETPNDPSVKYGLYLNSRERKAGDQALNYLEKAVALDQTYGLEYLELASIATEKELPMQSLRMLRLATETFAENGFIALSLAQELLQNNQEEEARAIISRLETLPWSTTYYPGMPASLRQMTLASE